MNTPSHIPDYTLLQKSMPESTKNPHWLRALYTSFLERARKHFQIPPSTPMAVSNEVAVFHRKARTGITYCDLALWEIQKADFSLRQGNISVAEHKRIVDEYMYRQFIHHADFLRSVLHEVELKRAPDIFRGFQDEASALSQNMSLFLDSEDTETISRYLSQLKHFFEKLEHQK